MRMCVGHPFNFFKKGYEMSEFIIHGGGSNSGGSSGGDATTLGGQPPSAYADASNTYTKPQVDQLIEDILGAAPAALDTLKELSDALGGDDDFAATMTGLLALKASITDMNDGLDTKYDKTVIDQMMNLKVSLTVFNNAMNTKADSSVVASALALKADITDVNAALALKADISYVDDELAGKADATSTADALDIRYTKEEVNALLDSKASTDDLDDLVSEIDNIEGNKYLTEAQLNQIKVSNTNNVDRAGFIHFGKHNNTTNNVNDGLYTVTGEPNTIYMGRRHNAKTGKSKTDHAVVTVGGIIYHMKESDDNPPNALTILMPEAPTINHVDDSQSGLVLNGDYRLGNTGAWSMGSGFSMDSANNELHVTTTVNYSTSSQYIPVTKGMTYIVSVKSPSSGLYLQIRDGDTNDTMVFTNGLSTNAFSGGVFEIVATSEYIRFINHVSTADVVNGVFYPVAIYPKDEVERSDLVFTEFWPEDVSLKGMVYPYGNTQWSGGDILGLTGITEGSFNGSDTYSLYGSWQTPGTVVGKGYVWDDLSEEHKKIFASYQPNNVHITSHNDFIQNRYRNRSMIADESIDYFKYLGGTCGNNFTRYAMSQGSWSEVAGTSVCNSSYQWYLTPFSHFPFNQYVNDHTLWQPRGYNGTNGLCTGPVRDNYFAMPICKVKRLNKGAYHPMYNPRGSMSYYIKTVTHNGGAERAMMSNIQSTIDCFNTDPASPINAVYDVSDGVNRIGPGSGNILSNRTGRPDGTYHDQIYSNQIVDYRLPAKGQPTLSSFNKLINNSVRGAEGDFTLGSKRTNKCCRNVNGTYEYVFQDMTLTNVEMLVAINPTSGILHTFKRTGRMYSSDFPEYTCHPPFNDTSLTDQWNSTGNISYKPVINSDGLNSGTRLHCDLIGDPNDYPSEWTDSVLGVNTLPGIPLNVSDTGTSLIPNGSLIRNKLSHRVSNALFLIKTTDGGVTWTRYTSWNNSMNGTENGPAGHTTGIYLVFYITPCSTLDSTGNDEIRDNLIGDVLVTGTERLNAGCALMRDLIGKVGTASYPGSFGTNIPLTQISTRNMPKHQFYVGNAQPWQRLKHDEFTMREPGSTRSVVKALPYMTADGMNVLYKESVWDDDASPHVYWDSGFIHEGRNTTGESTDITLVKADGTGGGGDLILNNYHPGVKKYIDIKVNGKDAAGSLSISIREINATGNFEPLGNLDSHLVYVHQRKRRYMIPIYDRFIHAIKFEGSMENLYIEQVSVVKAGPRLPTTYLDGSWGDDSEFNITDARLTAIEDDNGHLVKIGQKKVKLKSDLEYR